MLHVFISNVPVIDGKVITDHIYPTRYLVVYSTSDYIEAYDTMANIQHTLPCHNYVGVYEESSKIILWACSGLIWAIQLKKGSNQ